MKLHLGCGEDIRFDYVNIDLIPNLTLPPEVYRQGDVGSLDWVCGEAAAEEILAIDVLQYLPWMPLPQILRHWVSRLQPGGRMKLAQPDLHQVAARCANDTLDYAAAMRTLFGEQRHVQDCCRSAIDSRVLCQWLTECGMTIRTKRYTGDTFFVEAVKEGTHA
jgi:trans-aconitate methyltransferase